MSRGRWLVFALAVVAGLIGLVEFLALSQRHQIEYVLGVVSELASPLPSPLPSPILLSDQREVATVASIVDGDTIKLLDGRTVRYIGIDTPETKHPTQPVGCFGAAAAEKNRDLVEGKTVYLQKDINDTDRYQRLLRYVWLDELMVNKVLVAEGFAFARSYPPDVAFQDEFRAAEAEARSANRGLWAACPQPI